MQLVLVFLSGEDDTVPTNPHAKPDHSNIPPQYQRLVGQRRTGRIVGYDTKPHYFACMLLDKRGKIVRVCLYHLRVAWVDGAGRTRWRAPNLSDRFEFTLEWDGERLFADHPRWIS